MYTVVQRVHLFLPRVMALCAATIALSVFMYGFLLLGAVGHTASRSSTEEQIRTLSSELGLLEARYLSHTREISPDLAAAMGFVSPTETSVVFANRDALSLNPGSSGF